TDLGRHLERCGGDRAGRRPGRHGLRVLQPQRPGRGGLGAQGRGRHELATQPVGRPSALNKEPIMKYTLCIAMLAAAAATGCASIAVTDEALVDRTAFALGLAKGDFTISNRVDEGTTTRYSVK